MKKLFKPFESIAGSAKTIMLTSWLAILIIFWTVSSLSDTNLFPTPLQVLTGFEDLWANGLVVQIASSLSLCFQAIILSLIISLVFAYSTAIPFFKPFGLFISKLRYLPLTGIAFYLAIAINNARTLQVWVLVVFMTTFLITSLMQVISDIAEEEFDHAKTLGCNRWEVLLEVVIKGRLDYVIESVRQNLAIVWVMIVTVESILVAGGGLGVLIKESDKLGSNGRVIAVQIIIILIGIALDWLLTKIRKIIFRYSNF